ncbi:amidohydrolase [Streptomyces sp. DI166]|uniref:M20 family metallopeptidase n=1 Tax=Streptomyces sp. DI166 TaxID=1839783 RepID=UPI0007F3937D|nr:M20 family metallopeptidase [Streptomyces sp. DI166]SBT89524.1 amidohydrolase [Streptomyces sp. DI166]
MASHASHASSASPTSSASTARDEPPAPSLLAAEIALLRPRLEAVSLAIHDRPELKFAEYHAHQVLTRWLTEGGFVVESGIPGMETAFVAVHRGTRPGPCVALLAEYDALPGVGHGCGHNLIAAGAVAAALAVVRTLPAHPGTVAVIGTPGEEMGGAGKVRLAEAGVFEGVDAALMFHPSDRSVTTQHALAAAHLRIDFTGLSAHAARSPWRGRSALAGAQLFLNALDSMRQFMPPTARLHGVVADGGQAPNVVPAHAAVELFVRDRTTAAAEELVERVRAAAEGAALATGTAVEVSETGPLYAERRDSLVLAERFGRAVRELGLDIGPGAPDEPAGSSDIGNLSHLLPVIHPYIRIAPPGTPAHSRAMREAAAGTFAHDRTEIAAAGLARVTAELLMDPQLLDAAREEFAAVRPTGAEPSAVPAARPTGAEPSAVPAARPTLPPCRS